MAYSSGSRRGGSRGGARRSSRGGSRDGYRGGSRGNGDRGGARSRRAPPQRSGGPNATAMGVGVILLIGVIAVVIIASGGKERRPVPETYEEVTGETKVERNVEAPREPDRPPPPDISPEIIQVAKEIVEWMATDEAKAKTAHEAAMAAKQRRNDEEWQAKLTEAREHLLNIRERWNNEVVAEIEGELPMSCPYDADEVANYHVGREAGKVTKALEFLSAISKQIRR